VKPIIGVIARPNASTTMRDKFYINKEINDAIVKNGGVAIIIIPPVLEKLVCNNLENTSKLNSEQIEDMKGQIDLCDGIICPGGDDFFDYDLKIIEYCHQCNKPLLGICLGMQAMSYLFNGKMVDFNHLDHKSEKKYVHKVKLNKNSMLYHVLNAENIMVNSRHKSYIISTDLNICGISGDDIIEAVEDKNKKFFIGVQWHPESMIDYDKKQNNLFEYFIKCCSSSFK